MISDKEARKLIVSEINKNFFVEASAGSGKTTSLVHRMVAMVEEGIPVDKICTITFTKAAADEFFVRFQKLLSERSVISKDEKDAEKILKAKRCQDALVNIDSCFLGTTDSIVNMIAHEMPSEIDIPSDSEVIDKDVLAGIIKKEYDELISNIDHPLHKYALEYKNIAGNDAYEDFSLGIMSISDKRNSAIIYDKTLLNINESYFKDVKDDFMKIAKAIAETKVDFGIGQSADNRRANKAKVEIIYKKLKGKDLATNIVDLKWLSYNIRHITAYPTDVVGTELTSKNIVVEPEGREKTCKLSEETVAILNKVDAKIDNYIFTIYIHLITNALDDICKKLKEKGQFTFYDYLYYVTQAFKKSASTDEQTLIKHIFERHSHFLIDESQDTNPMQTELFFYLTGTKKSEDWTKTSPKEGSLFIVGDPKQSIYGFRDANVDAYQKTKAIFAEKDEVLTLTRNFRSNRSLREWFNEVMNDVLHHDEKDLIHPDIPFDEDPEFELEGEIKNDDLVYDGVYRYGASATEEYGRIAEFIRSLVDDKRNKIIVKHPTKRGKYLVRSIDYKDFLIVPRSTVVGKCIEQFQLYKIPCVIEAKIPFSDSESLVLLNKLVKLMKQPFDKAALIDVLFSPLFGLNYYDITSLRNSNFNFDISDISSLNVDEKYHDIITLLNELYFETKDLSFSSTYIYLLNSSKLSVLNVIDSANLEYTYYFIEKVKEKEESGLIVNIAQLNDYINLFLENNTDDQRVLRFKEELNRVKIANLHKVKGLEAPIVILVHPSEADKKPTNYTDYSGTAPKTYYRAFSKLNSHGGSSEFVKTTLISDEELAKWKKKDDGEADRLQYVAATRPTSVLFIADNVNQRGGTHNPWGALVDKLKEKETFTFPPFAGLEESEKQNVKYNKSSVDETSNKQSVLYHSPSDIKASGPINNQDEIVKSPKDDASKIGTIVHRLMECIVSSRGECGEDIISEIIRDYDASKYEQLLKNIYSTITNGGFPQKNSKVEQDILKILLNAEQVMCEVPFSYKEGDTVTSGIIDLVYLDKDGYHIIDYKTNKDDDVSNLEKKYASQLNDYIEVFKDIGAVDAHIYHININE